jgi:hypothetical protein
VIRRRRDEDVVTRKRYGRAIRRVEALLFYGPRFSKVAADAKPNSGRSDYDAGIRLLHAYLVNITVDIDGGLPGFSAVP